MNVKCPRNGCKNRRSKKNPGTPFRPIARNGWYYRTSDSKRIERFRCRNCNAYFSRATGNPNYRQKRRRLNPLVYQLLNAGVSQRRLALVLGANRKTIVRTFRFVAAQARAQHEVWLKDTYGSGRLPIVQFDDLVTAEHTKCKPLSVALAVEPKTRKILAFEVSQAPANGTLAAVAFKKYGPRKDLRPEGWHALMKKLKPIVHEDVTIVSDESPLYPKYIKKHHPNACHQTHPGKRGCIAGQGELKKIGFDPLFALNHTCAMLRANLNRLFRRTWCISKTPQGLIDHISIYVKYHNQVLTPTREEQQA